MKPFFYIAAAVMIAAALTLLLLPLLRHGRRSGRPRSVFVLMLGIALVVPVGAVLLYRQVGTPAALDGVQAVTDVKNALDELRAHLAAQPNDVQGWMLLAQADMEMQQPEEARDAYGQVLKQSPDNTTALVGWAQADSTAHEDHHISDRARDLLERAVKLEPDNQRGLWLLGISDFQQARFAEAAATWRKLQPMLQPGTNVAQAVAEQIALADARAGSAPAAASSTAVATSNTDQGPALHVQVTLSPKLGLKLTKGDTLFVYARAVDGPPMPLAVTRLDADQLKQVPAKVTLTDAMSMVPSMKLSSVPRVVVGARISHSGNAVAQAGDLEGDSGVIDVDSKTPIHILVDKVHN
ncbi:tetratricopeptide repeat protein [Dyella acidisoli]|uniref:Cytochrome c biogenesis protein n=1 Tax=Dyella acidisoli TaxID=1867834 RepID=A0ABQ5XWD9_9GAMM|nr:tetratricopeptide repeat protein [Dyella acidisoli]GLQ95258.1 cytochrome c biogenesis protein [Dyella acidisoli]